MKKIFSTVLAFMLIFLTGCGESKSVYEKKLSAVNEKTEMKIKISIGDKIFDAVLEDNPTTHELVKNFPLEIMMTELNGNEKYFKFGKTFPTADSRVEKIHTGDLMLYGSNYLVLFYKDFSTNYSYTRLGKIKNPVDLAKNVGTGNILVKFEK